MTDFNTTKSNKPDTNGFTFAAEKIAGYKEENFKKTGIAKQAKQSIFILKEDDGHHVVHSHSINKFFLLLRYKHPESYKHFLLNIHSFR